MDFSVSELIVFAVSRLALIEPPVIVVLTMPVASRLLALTESTVRVPVVNLVSITFALDTELARRYPCTTTLSDTTTLPTVIVLVFRDTPWTLPVDMETPVNPSPTIFPTVTLSVTLAFPNTSNAAVGALVRIPTFPTVYAICVKDENCSQPLRSNKSNPSRKILSKLMLPSTFSAVLARVAPIAKLVVKADFATLVSPATVSALAPVLLNATGVLIVKEFLSYFKMSLVLSKPVPVA